MCLQLAFVISFQKDSYVVGNKNVGPTPVIELKYPSDYGNLQMFPINVTVQEIDINTTSKS